MGNSIHVRANIVCTNVYMYFKLTILYLLAVLVYNLPLPPSLSTSLSLSQKLKKLVKQLEAARKMMEEERYQCNIYCIY